MGLPTERHFERRSLGPPSPPNLHHAAATRQMCPRLFHEFTDELYAYLSLERPPRRLCGDDNGQAEGRRQPRVLSRDAN